MLLFIGSCVFCLVVGFGLGRVKNAAKLAEVTAALEGLENTSEAGIKAVLAKIKAKL